MVESTRLAYPVDFVADAVGVFATGDYFEAHERFEEAWLASGTPRSLELHALAQIAAAMHKHVTQRKPLAARAILGRARAKLGRVATSAFGVDLDALRRSIDRFLEGDGSERVAIVLAPRA